VATRRRGIEDLVAAVEAAAAGAVPAGEGGWVAPDAEALRGKAAEAERIMRACVRPPERPDTLTGRIDSVLLHPVAGLLILSAVMFVMFQAVFAWATPAADGIEALLGGLGAA